MYSEARDQTRIAPFHHSFYKQDLSYRIWLPGAPVSAHLSSHSSGLWFERTRCAPPEAQSSDGEGLVVCKLIWNIPSELFLNFRLQVRFSSQFLISQASLADNHLLHCGLQMRSKILWFASKMNILAYIFIWPRLSSFLQSSGKLSGWWQSDLVSSAFGVCIQPSHLAWQFSRCPQNFLSYHRSQSFQKGLPDVADSCSNSIWPPLIPE